MCVISCVNSVLIHKIGQCKYVYTPAPHGGLNGNIETHVITWLVRVLSTARQMKTISSSSVPRRAPFRPAVARWRTLKYVMFLLLLSNNVCCVRCVFSQKKTHNTRHTHNTNSSPARFQCFLPKRLAPSIALCVARLFESILEMIKTNGARTTYTMKTKAPSTQCGHKGKF